MIAAVGGTLVERTGDMIAIETSGGLTYELSVPVNVLEGLPEPGRSVRLHTVLVVREDAWSLYGFDETRDRHIFQKLLGASGVGPRLALALMSALGGNRVVRALQEEDIGLLCTVPGVGKKTAQKIVVELKDRTKGLASEEEAPPEDRAASQAIQALMNLGYSSTEAEKTVRSVIADSPDLDTGALIKRALQQFTGKK